MHQDATTFPRTAAAVGAERVADRYCSRALYAHCVRSYLWGVAHARRAGLEIDDELFYVAAMLHDLGLTRPFDAHVTPFEEAGGHVAWVFGTAAGWSQHRCERVAQVVERHMWQSVDPAADAEGHLLEVATGIDISGRGLDLVPEDVQQAVCAQWPRGDLATEFTGCLRAQAERKPTSRAADLVRGGLVQRMAAHPLEAGRAG